MKRNYVFPLMMSAAVVLLAVFFALQVAAAGVYGDLDLVTDAAGLLSADEVNTLESRAERLSADGGCAVYIVTVQSMDGYDVDSFTEAVHSEYNLGYGSEKSTIMLLVAPADRDYGVMAYGYGNTVLTDYGRQKMIDSFLPDLSDDDYYAAFTDYLDTCENYLNLAAAGTPYDINLDTEPMDPFATAGMFGAAGLALGAIVAFVTCSIFKAQMKTANEQTQADNYVAPGSVQLTGRRDVFLRRNVVRTPRPKPQSSGGGGGGTSINSGGFSHSSGKY